MAVDTSNDSRQSLQFYFNPSTSAIQPSSELDAFNPSESGKYTIEADDHTLTSFTLRYYSKFDETDIDKSVCIPKKKTIVDFHKFRRDSITESHIQTLQLHAKFNCTAPTIQFVFENSRGAEISVLGREAFTMAEVYNIFRQGLASIAQGEAVKSESGVHNPRKVLILSDLDETIVKDTPVRIEGTTLVCESSCIEPDFVELHQKFRADFPEVSFVVVTNTSEGKLPTKFAQCGLSENMFTKVLPHKPRDSHPKTHKPTKTYRVEELLSGGEFTDVIIVDDSLVSISEQVQVAQPKVGSVTVLHYLKGVPLSHQKAIIHTNLKFEQQGRKNMMTLNVYKINPVVKQQISGYNQAVLSYLHYVER